MNGNDSNTSGASQAKLHFKPAQANDKISGEIIEELSRRGFMAIEITAPGNILIQVAEPTDHTKIWIKSDVNGIPQGVPLAWNPQTGKWEPTAQASAAPYVPPARRSGIVATPAGKSQQTLGPFETVKTEKYFVWLTPSLFRDGSWQTPPDAFPANFGYMLSGKGENSFQANFYGIPTGGLVWEWMIEVMP